MKECVQDIKGLSVHMIIIRQQLLSQGVGLKCRELLVLIMQEPVAPGIMLKILPHVMVANVNKNRNCTSYIFWRTTSSHVDAPNVDLQQ